MSTCNLSDFPHPLDNHDSDDAETQPDPTESDLETRPVRNPDQEEEITLISSANMPQKVTGSQHIRNPHLWLGPNKRKKGKGKGKPNFKKLQILEKKLQSLMEILKPIPFKPHKFLDFSKYEDLFRKLGLWDFVTVDFDKNVRKDLLVQLVASYESRCSYVNGHRINVTRPDLARAFKIPLKKDKYSVDSESFPKDAIAFILEFVSEWLLLHDDMWMMPDEVMNWMKMVKEGHPEKVDWAGMIWFMVEKELAQGEKLKRCYYASHLQHLMKEQKVFSREEAEGIVVGLREEVKEVDGVSEGIVVGLDEQVKEVDGVNEGNEKVDDAVKVGVGPSVELTLGQENVKEEDNKESEIMDLDSFKEKDDDFKEKDDGAGVNEQDQWLMHGKNDAGDHFFQGCGSENGRELGEDSKFGTEEVEFEGNGEAGDKFNILANNDVVGDGLTGNFLQSMEGNEITFNPGHSGIQQMTSGPSFLNDSGKRVIEHDDNVMFSQSLNERNKRLKINGPIEQKLLDFGTCLDNTQKLIEQARIFYQEKENAIEECKMHSQIILSEIHKRDDMIELLQKSRYEEMQKKENDIYRYERELILMGSALDGYRNALKDTERAFDEYRKKAKLLEEPACNDVGGGLMLSTGEIELICKKTEEEFQMNSLIVEQRLKEAEKDLFAKFDAFLEKINILDKKLSGLEANAKELRGLVAKRKVIPTYEKVPEVAELPAKEEKVAEVVAELNPAGEVDNCH